MHKKNSRKKGRKINMSSSSKMSRRSQIHIQKVQLPKGVAPFIQISQNDFLGLKRQKLKADDIAICECVYDETNPESACGERCLNVLTSTECTVGYCPCREHCKNQKFQKCEYARTMLFKTEGRGWGLLADENIKAGQFITEYCGELISLQEANQRSHAYVAQGLKDFYMISLNAHCFIDATNKGSLARFINHSCQPNCETRKWVVLGETRVGIFAKEDISAGTELSYDYNFEWYGGTAVRCLCGAPNCSLFLGAKSRRFQLPMLTRGYGTMFSSLFFLGAKSRCFQEHSLVWEDGDDRYMVDDIPLYNSAEDKHIPHYTSSPSEHGWLTEEEECSVTMGGSGGSGTKSEVDSSTKSSSVLRVGANSVEGKNNEAAKLCLGDTEEAFFLNFNIRSGLSKKKKSQHTSKGKAKAGPGSTTNKKSQKTPKGKSRVSGKKQSVAQLFSSKEVQAEVTKYEEIKNKATAELNSLYDEIRPAIEEHNYDSQDCVDTSIAKKWHATCSKYKADSDFHFSIIKNVICPPKPATKETRSSAAGDN